jgi:hypothetical protein
MADAPAPNRRLRRRVLIGGLLAALILTLALVLTVGKRNNKKGLHPTQQANKAVRTCSFLFMKCARAFTGLTTSD